MYYNALIGGTALQVNGWLAGVQAGFTTFMTAIFAFIPNLIAALIILLVGYLVIRVVTRALRWGMNRANLEKHIGNTRIGQAIERSGQTLTNIVVNIVFWVFAFIVIVYAISALQIPPLTATMVGILDWIPLLIGVAIIVFAGLLIGSWIGKGLENTLPRYGVGGGRLIGIIAEVLIYLFVFNIAIIQLGIGQGIIFMITTAMAWGLAAAIAIGFGGALLYSLREVLPAMVSGTTTIASTLKPGQNVTIQGMPNIGDGGTSGFGTLRGRVSNVGMFNTVLQREGGGFVVVPNELLMDKPVFVEGGVPPRPFEHQLRDRMSEFNDRFEEHVQDTQPSNGGTQRPYTEPTRPDYERANE